jgi:hypothetical protein
MLLYNSEHARFWRSTPDQQDHRTIASLVLKKPKDVFTTRILVNRGSNRLQLNKGGGATPFLLRDLDCGGANSIPTAPTKLIPQSLFFASGKKTQQRRAHFQEAAGFTAVNCPPFPRITDDG